MQTFEAIAGNRDALWLLQTALDRDEVSHSYLFHGPSGVGKRTVALHFGAVLVAGEDEAARQRALRGLHPDLVEIEPEGQFTTIGQVRGVIARASEKPFEGLRRVFVLHAETLNLQSSNALLKTLEEPEGRTVFVLLATSRESVLPTILSRSQALRFNPVPVPEVEEFLRQRGFEEPSLAASLGRGSVGLSLRYAGGELDGVREEIFSALDPERDAEERHGIVEGITSRAEKLGEETEKGFLEEFEEPDRRAKDEAKRAGRAARDGVLGEALGLLALLYRDAAVVASGAPDLAVNTDRLGEIERVVEEHPNAGWIEAAARAERAREDLAHNLSPDAVLETVLLEARRDAFGSSRVR